MDKESNLLVPNADFQRILYLINMSLFQASKRLKIEVKNKFKLFAFTLLRQRQLARAKFSCSCFDGDFERYLEEHEDVITASKDVDPHRVIWVHEKILNTFLIQAGQWVRLCKFENYAKSEFVCQIMPIPAQVLVSNDYAVIKVHPVTEFNLRKSLACSTFLPIGNLQIKPLLTNPVIKTSNKSVSFTPILGKSVILSHLKCASDIALNECDILIKDYFLNTKYFCVGDSISVPFSNDSKLHLVLTEINGKQWNDANTCKELFKISLPSVTLSLSSNEIACHFNQTISKECIKQVLPPCLNVPFKKVCEKIEQGLMLSSLNRTNSTVSNSQLDLWPTILLYGSIGTGKSTICQVAAKFFGLNFHLLNTANLIGDTSAYTEAKLRAVFEKIKTSLCPAVVLIKNLHLIGKDKEGHEDKRIVLAFKDFIQDVTTLSVSSVSERNVMISKAVFIIGSTDQPNNLIPCISQMFLFKVQSVGVVSPIHEIESTLQWLFSRGNVKIESAVNLQTWAKENFDGMQRNYGDLKAMSAIVIRHAFVRTMGIQIEENAIQDQVCEINLEDLNNGVRAIDLVYKKAASAIEIPKVHWEDIGGMKDVKKELISSVRLPLEFPHLFSSGVRRSGILLYGPPGTGKTLIAKAVATEFKLSFLSVKGPELLNMYVGQSEQNVRDVFAKARGAAPCIIFFDELDSLAPNRGRAGDSGGVMDRVVSQILAELDGTHSTSNVFIIGATNRPDLIDPALLRPGRFDKLLYVGINEDIHSKCSVLQALTRKVIPFTIIMLIRFHLHKEVCLENVASLLPKGMSGADMYSLCSDAYMTAVERQISQLSLNQRTDSDTGEKAEVIVSFQDFHNAITRATPSISDNEYARYEALKTLKR